MFIGRLPVDDNVPEGKCTWKNVKNTFKTIQFFFTKY